MAQQLLLETYESLPIQLQAQALAFIQYLHTIRNKLDVAAAQSQQKKWTCLGKGRFVDDLSNVNMRDYIYG